MKRIYILILITCFLMLTGCGSKNYSRSDVKKYVQNLNVSKNFKVSSKPIKFKSSDNYDEELWSVEDKENNLTFYVLNDYKYKMESTTNELRDNFSSAYYLKNEKNISNIDNIKYRENSILKSENKMKLIELYCNYTNKKELIKCYDSYKLIADYFTSRSKNINLRGEVEYNSKYYQITKDGLNAENAYLYLNDFNKENDENVKKRNKEAALYNYYRYGVSYQVESIINDMSEEDWNSLLNNSYTKKIYKLNEAGSVEKTYEKLVAPKHGDITINTLYYILKEEGFDPNGDAHHYYVNDINGNKIEFSDDFYDVTDQKELKFYYNKNGIKQSDKSSNNTYSVKDINEMFGLNLRIDK